MTTPTDLPTPTLGEALHGSWFRFLDLYEPLRPELFRYCRCLTRSPWDAEDLAQDALARAFATLGRMQGAPASPKAWLFRIASNLWLDRVRRERLPPPEAMEPTTASAPRETREAAGTLIARLSPRERAAVVLKDAFDLTLEEVAEALSTTPGAVKAALHRGRGKLQEPIEREEERTPPPAVLNEFCAAFNARDLDRLTALLLDTAAIEVVGVHEEYGPEAARNGVFQGMLYGSRRMAQADKLGGMDPQFIQGVLPEPPRFELRVHRGEPLLLGWYRHADGVEAVRAVTRAETDGEKVTRVINYFFTPELLADVCGELGVPFRSNGHLSCRARETMQRSLGG